MKYQSIRGMEDILPEDAGLWQWIENQARKFLESCGYSEIRTPILEDTSIFVRSIGETTDIVTKEMYTFEDRKGRSLTLRPEGTAPIVRAYIEHSLDKNPWGSKLYYIGPMFRSEKPQKGRSRQFHQIGVERFGSRSPVADAEVIVELSKMLNASFGLKNFTIKLNSLGCKKDKLKFADELQKYLKDKISRLCEDCKSRIDKNILRVLDCKMDTCIQIIRNAPNVIDSLCSSCKEDYLKVKEILDKLDVSYKETKNLVRGLDYYTGTVFEITHTALGGQDAIGAGGRYDNLVKDLGGPDVGAVGYALGMERIILALGKKAALSEQVFYVATLGDQARIEGLIIAHEIRQECKCKVILSDEEASLKSQLRQANSQGAKFSLIIGDNEIKNGEIILRNMATSTQEPVKRENLFKELKRHIGC